MINYCINDNGTLFIYKDNYILAEINNCEHLNEQELNNLIDEIIGE